MHKKILIISLAAVGFLGIFSAQKVLAANVWGWAWAENTGWISFNCLNDYNNDGVRENHCAFGGNVDYGAQIDNATGLFSGYIWSENFGWISFNQSDLVGCPSGTCEAKIDLATGAVSGWAKPLFGSNNWIKLNPTAAGANGVHLVGSEFHGWAFGGANSNDEAILGLISFNHTTGGGAIDYKVETDLAFSNLPTATGLNRTEGSYCSAGDPPIFLHWTFSDPDAGDVQSAYQIQIDNSGSGFPSPEIDSGKVNNASNIYTPIGLSFNQTYHWRIKVWDNNGGESDWVVAPSFTTQVNWPDPRGFTWDPTSIKTGDTVSFTNNTTNCSPCSYLWDFGDTVTDNAVNPTHSFTSPGTFSINLTATSGGRSCMATLPLDTKMRLPTWREVNPAW